MEKTIFYCSIFYRLSLSVLRRTLESLPSTLTRRRFPIPPRSRRLQAVAFGVSKKFSIRLPACSQNYARINPTNGYLHNVLYPKMGKLGLQIPEGAGEGFSFRDLLKGSSIKGSSAKPQSQRI